jgi:hypothetical protein
MLRDLPNQSEATVGAAVEGGGQVIQAGGGEQADRRDREGHWGHAESVRAVEERVVRQILLRRSVSVLVLARGEGTARLAIQAPRGVRRGI